MRESVKVEKFYLSEDYDLKKVVFLLENPAILGKNDEDQQTRNTNFLKEIVYNNGVIDTKYTRSKNFGRWSCPNGIQGISKDIRNFLLKDKDIIDVDMKNAHPTILHYIAEKYGITKIPCLKKYVEDREFVFNEYMPEFSPTKGKEMVLIATNCDRNDLETENEWLLSYKKEVNRIIDHIKPNKDFEKMKKFAEKKCKNEDGTFINYVLTHFEELIIQDIMKFVKNHDIELFSYMYDGVMIKATELNIAQVNKYIKRRWDDPLFEFVVKPIGSDKINSITIPESFDFTEFLEKINETNYNYDHVKKIWEEKHGLVKILDPPIFFVKVGGKYVAYEKEKLITAFNEVKAYSPNDGEKSSFIKSWLEDEKMMKKSRIVNESNNENVQPDEFNIWVDFDVVKISQNASNFKYNQEAINTWLKLVDCLANNEKEPADLLVKWVASLFQFPDVKNGICPIISGSYGCGKDSFLAPIKILMGKSKFFLTEGPEKHVWGHFNKPMENKNLIHLSEVGLKQTAEYMEKIKGLITNEEITIKEECKAPYVTKSLHNYIILTNHDCPINITEGQRRFVQYCSSNTYKSNKIFWDEYYDLWKDEDNLLSLYRYLMELPNVRGRFVEQDLIFTKFHKAVAEDNEPIEIRFLREYVIDKKEEDSKLYTERVLCNDMLVLFNAWRRKNITNVKNDYTSQKFGIYLNKLMNNTYPMSIIKKEKVSKGALYTINFERLYSDLKCDEYNVWRGDL